jgi:hypothetical protein
MLLNFGLLRHPGNWLIVAGVLFFWLVVAYLVETGIDNHLTQPESE